MSPGRLSLEVFWAHSTGKRPQNGPRTHWRDYLCFSIDVIYFLEYFWLYLLTVFINCTYCVAHKHDLFVLCWIVMLDVFLWLQCRSRAQDKFPTCGTIMLILIVIWWRKTSESLQRSKRLLLWRATSGTPCSARGPQWPVSGINILEGWMDGWTDGQLSFISTQHLYEKKITFLNHAGFAGLWHQHLGVWVVLCLGNIRNKFDFG